jgi:L-lactate utilization protein LutB
MTRLEQVAGQFQKKGIECRVFPDAQAVVAHLTEALNPADRVAMGGSVTLQELGVYELLKERGHEVLWHWKVPREEADALRRDAMAADVYMTSSNAVIEDGRLLNIDGTGNRVAAMFFGPPRVIVIAGRNKLAPDYPAALERIQTVACPRNAERLKRDVPCRYTGKCQDCRSPERMCQITVSIANRLDGRRLEVWLVNQELGY